ncbi:DUF6162 family protein (plasmid) [Cereibacter azotoformans]|uniref:DUF6162 family protein n=1 Tax=Cereibacter azotoformans TaxID=43057 RepID=UPI001EEC8499|nr:DUF6162 family protein [Cereibacter azotoformans]ULB12402.1 DUF6162 family protein [Cereibacter azotoformans]
MTTTWVRPASARRESLLVGALCLAVLVASAAVIGLHRRADDIPGPPAWQIDSRSDLTPGEQGILADLAIAASEIAWLTEGGALPDVTDLAAEGIPPFVHQASDGLRGGHVWSQSGGVYLGRSGDPLVAGSFLLIPGDPSTIWLAPGTADAPADPSQDTLRSAGWRQVVSRYVASVTRHDHGAAE